jgi:hypothetical protein
VEKLGLSNTKPLERFVMRYTPSAMGPAVGLDGVDGDEEVGGLVTGDEAGGCVVAGGGAVDVEAEFVLKVTLLT